MRQSLLTAFAVAGFGGFALPSLGQTSTNSAALGQIEARSVRFDRSKLEQKRLQTEMSPELPSKWSSYRFLTLELRQAATHDPEGRIKLGVHR